MVDYKTLGIGAGAALLSGLAGLLIGAKVLGTEPKKEVERLGLFENYQAVKIGDYVFGLNETDSPVGFVLDGDIVPFTKSRVQTYDAKESKVEDKEVFTVSGLKALITPTSITSTTQIRKR